MSLIIAKPTNAQDADISEPKSANGKVLKVGSLVVPASMKEKRRELARVVVRVEGKDPKYGFGPFVFLKGQSGAFYPAWLYAFDGCAADSAAPDKAKRKEMEKEIRNITDYISRGFFHDEQFLATRMVADALRKVGYRVEVTGGNYINNGKSKEYKIRAEKEGEVFNGAIYLMAAGTIDDPFKRYDVSVMW